ncbi:TNT domain-containing protein [Streptomyces sp. NBC_01142]|uniref:TNT domain-containing protein n=1 Tax=Streptomyces sp. NBC_01142 TaxID=2975865 RepID=UPI0022536916|nr:TNT domain-containing protein [Streptomyces sp. NBC_01142]MCX4825397.1 TNT domain-containing protein [Streptomyces sp. NBC_01142]
MRLSRWCTSLAALGGLAGSLVLGASVSSAAPADKDGTQAARPTVPAPGLVGAPTQLADEHDGPGQPRVCKGLVPDPIPPALRAYYFCGDWRLGPTLLPTHGALRSILHGYERLGGLTAVRFLDRWWNPAGDSGQGDWRYPPDDGYTHRNQTVLAAPLVLHAGLKLDRFGSEAGRFLAPAGTKYGKRSIPPSGLNTIDPRYPYDYHLYRLAKDVTVCAGTTAPGFEQPGLGTQYVTSSQFCPDIPRTTVSDLVRNGTLVRLNK